jgi:hypothetical protein
MGRLGLPPGIYFRLRLPPQTELARMGAPFMMGEVPAFVSADHVDAVAGRREKYVT